MGFSISHKVVSEKKQNVGNRKENTMNKTNENTPKENSQKKEASGGNSSDEMKFPPIRFSTNLSIGNIMKGKSEMSAVDIEKKRKREEIERKRKALAKKNHVIVHL